MRESRLIFIINPRSGGGRGRDVLSALRRYARASDPRVVIEELAFDKSAEQLTRVTQDDTVVIGGGDGTVSRMLDGLRGRGCRVGLLPLGTGNDLARELGIFDRVRRAAPADLFAFYRSAPTRAVSVFTLEYGAHYSSAVTFINYVSLGFDAKVVAGFARRRHTPPWNKFQSVWINRLLYGLLCLRFLNYRVPEGTVVGGGGFHREIRGARSLLFTNIRSIMGLGVSNEKSDPSDEQLECVVVEGILDYLSMVMPRSMGFHLPSVCGSASSWEVRGVEHALPIQVDGEARPDIVSSMLRIRVTGSVQMVVGGEG